MKFTFRKLLFLVAYAAVTVNAQYGSRDVETRDAGKAQSAKTGTVVDTRQVTLRETKNQWSNFSRPGFDTSDGCAVMGAAAGGVVGSKVGKGNGQILGALLGASLAAHGAKKACADDKHTAVDLIVKMDSGQMIVISQGDDAPLAIGTRVWLIEGGARARVAPISRDAAVQ
jgi:outer membrane lipoprotein SlyB